MKPNPTVMQRRARNLPCYALTLAMAVIVSGCSNHIRPRHYQTLPRTQRQDTHQAQSANDEGLALIEDQDLAGAERKFREALLHDLYYAPAHNNLGLILLQTGRPYEAAWEFDYAAKLAPRTAEPRQNLGLLYEQLGRMDKAIAEYEAACDIDPESAVAMGHLARAYVKTDRKDDRVKSLLERMSLAPLNHQWDVWARGQLIRIGRPEPGPDPAHPQAPN